MNLFKCSEQNPVQTKSWVVQGSESVALRQLWDWNPQPSGHIYKTKTLKPPFSMPHQSNLKSFFTSSSHVKHIETRRKWGQGASPSQEASCVCVWVQGLTNLWPTHTHAHTRTHTRTSSHLNLHNLSQITNILGAGGDPWVCHSTCPPLAWRLIF